ncbi:glycosyltransferase [Salinisphaera sp. T31B1]|uniref:glycosyltransferase n=1 Tax=Salinisphaera sp. T31B1 TaxID=727963 RepID=UPI00334019FC
MEAETKNGAGISTGSIPGRKRVDVIIRTLCEADRRDALLRALQTIGDQRGVSTRAIVVVNGSRFDITLRDEIAARSDVCLVQLEQASLIAAGLSGWDHVDAPYFTFLDDDDELIPDSLASPAGWLDAHPRCDVAVCNIYHERAGRRVLASPDMDVHHANPLLTLMSGCWLHPGAALFRSAAIERSLFDFQRPFMEWTTLAFRLVAQEKRLHFMQQPTVVYNDTQGSLSKGPEHQEHALLALAEIMAHPACDAQTYRRARYKYANTLHVLAMAYWQQGEYRKAWSRHLRSLRNGGLRRYALFTRKLVRPARSGPANSSG